MSENATEATTAQPAAKAEAPKPTRKTAARRTPAKPAAKPAAKAAPKRAAKKAETEKVPTVAESKAKVRESRAAAKKVADDAKRREQVKKELAREAEDKRKAEVEACEWIIVDRKRRYADVVTQVWNLAHPECPESPKAFEKFGANGPVMEWAAVCLEHDERGYYRRKDIAEANAADPWIFCTKCAEHMGDTVNVAK